MIDVIEEMGVPLTPAIADCLYTGISTDTGCFRFSSTTARTHKAAARVMEAGANIEMLNARLFESRSRGRIEIEKMALESLEYFFDGRCADDLPDLGPDCHLRRGRRGAGGFDQPAPLN